MIPINFASEDRQKARIASILSTATVFLTDQEVGELAVFLDGHTAANIRRAMLDASPPESGRTLLLLRALFREGPISNYAGAILTMVARDWKTHKGAVAPADVSEGLKQFGIETEPSVWEGIKDEGTLEGLSSWFSARAMPAIREYLPTALGAFGAILGPAGAAAGYKLGQGLAGPGSPPQLP